MNRNDPRQGSVPRFGFHGSTYRLRRLQACQGYMLIEVILAMTILAVSGVAIIQSMRACIDHSRSAEGYTTALFLTQSRLLELELKYANRFNPRLGRDRGTYEHLGRPDYWWESEIEYDRSRVAYHLKVTTHWTFKENEQEFTLETITPAARIREDLLR